MYIDYIIDTNEMINYLLMKPGPDVKVREMNCKVNSKYIRYIEIYAIYLVSIT